MADLGWDSHHPMNRLRSFLALALCAVSLAAAETVLKEAETLFPAEPTIQFNLGCYACQRDDLATARRRVDRAIALEPGFRLAAATDPDLAPLRAVDGTDCPNGA